MSVSALLSREVIAAAEDAGAFRADLLRAVKLSPAMLEGVDARVPHEVHLALWREAAHRSADPSFGLRVAQRMEPQVYGAVGFAMGCSVDLGDAAARLQHFSRLLYDELTVAQEPRGDAVAFTYRLSAREASPQLFEAALASLVLNARRLAGPSFRAQQISLRHRGTPRRLRQLLGAPVLFGQPEDAVLVAREALSLPVRGANPLLASVLDRHADELLSRLPMAAGIVAHVRRVLHMSLPGGSLSLTSVARQLGLGARTLQRRLAAEGRMFEQPRSRGLAQAIEMRARFVHTAAPTRSAVDTMGRERMRMFVAAVGVVLSATACNSERREIRKQLKVVEIGTSSALFAMRKADEKVQRTHAKMESTRVLEVMPSEDEAHHKLPAKVSQALSLAFAARDYFDALSNTVQPAADFMAATRTLKDPRAALDVIRGIHRDHLAACGASPFDGEHIVQCVARWEEMVRAVNAFGDAATPYDVVFPKVR